MLTFYFKFVVLDNKENQEYLYTVVASHFNADDAQIDAKGALYNRLETMNSGHNRDRYEFVRTIAYNEISDPVIAGCIKF